MIRHLDLWSETGFGSFFVVVVVAKKMESFSQAILSFKFYELDSRCIKWPENNGILCLLGVIINF